MVGVPAGAGNRSAESENRGLGADEIQVPASEAKAAATQGGNEKVQLRQVVYPNVGQSVDAMKQLVNDNTR